jgi:IS30 family transposase
MTETMRAKVSEAEQAELWRRYRGGQNCSEIGRALGRATGTIREVVCRHGGFSPRPRRRSARALSLSEREEISRGLSAERSLRQIAAALGRAASSISREVRRHGGAGGYRALEADQRAWRQGDDPRPAS